MFLHDVLPCTILVNGVTRHVYKIRKRYLCVLQHKYAVLDYWRFKMNLTRNFSLQEMIKSDTAIRKGIDNNPNADQIEKLKNKTSSSKN